MILGRRFMDNHNEELKNFDIFFWYYNNKYLYRQEYKGEWKIEDNYIIEKLEDELFEI